MENVKAKKNPIIKGIIGILIIAVIIVIIVIMLKIFTKNKNISTDQIDMKEAGSDSAEMRALKDIQTEANAGILKIKELTCNAEEVIDNKIVVVKCITNNTKVINHFDTKTIYYIYQETDDDYLYSIDKDKDEAIKKIKNY